MTTTTYQPQAGTIPFRVIAHFKTLPAGAELATAVLCELIDTDVNGFTSCMAAALRSGLVKRGHRAGVRHSYWSLGTGEALPEREKDDELADEPPRPANAFEPPKPSLAAVVWPFAQAQPVAAPEPEPEAPPPEPELPVRDVALAMRSKMPAPVAAAPSSPPHLVALELARFALWSDGALQIQRGEELLAMLTVAETRELVHYLVSTGQEA